MCLGHKLATFGDIAQLSPGSYDNGDGDAKKQKQLAKNDPPPSSKKNVGAIIVSGSGMIAIPDDWPEGEIALCPAKLCNKSKGCLVPGCQKNHKGPKHWYSALIMFMKTHVNADPTLTWNSAVMTPDILGLKFSTGKVDDKY